MNRETHNILKELLWKVENSAETKEHVERLNRMLAEEAGYTVRELEGKHPESDHTPFGLFDPEGEMVKWHWYESNLWLLAPNFALNSDDCFKFLPSPDDFFWNVSEIKASSLSGNEIFLDGYLARIEHVSEDIEYRGEKNLPSLAMCAAWIEYRFHQNRSTDKGE